MLEDPFAGHGEQLPGSTLKIVVLLNGGGGALSRLGEDAARSAVAAAMDRLGLVGAIHWCTGGELTSRGKQAVKDAGSEKLDAIVVGGGDGSVSLLAGLLAGTGIPLGVLPLGTLNHFARDLGLPAEIEPALAIVAGGQVRKVDLAEVNGRTFINNVSIGIYPQFVETRTAMTRRRIPKAMAAIPAAAASLAKFQVRRIRLKIEGSAEAISTPVLLVSNNLYDPGKLTSRQNLEGGRLGVWVARATTRLAFLRLALGAVAGRIPANLDLSETTSAEVSSRRTRLDVALDGEVVSLATPLRFRVRPAALTVLAPSPKGA